MNIILTNPAGISKKEICNKLSLSDKQVANLIYKLKKYGQIKKSGTPGVWVATHSSPSKNEVKKILKSTGKSVNIREKVLKVIAGYKNGARTAKIREKTGFGNKQVSNALYYLIRKKKIIRTETGLYKAI